MAAQPRKASDLHGNVPDNAPTVLMLVDGIDDLKFSGNQHLVKQAARLGRNIAALKQRCRKAGIPAIGVNDTRGRCRSDFKAVVSHCCEPGSAAWPLVEPLMPAPVA